MGQYLSLCCFFFFPECVFSKKNLLYEGKNSIVYKLPSGKFVCKIVLNYSMFLREKDFICFMKNKHHPHIIGYHHVIPDRHLLFFIEKANTDLFHWIHQNSTKPTYLYDLHLFLKQFANGYRFLVQHRIEHYDIKPDNLLIVGNILKIADFGTSQINVEKYMFDTGTYGFIAPEIVGITNSMYYIRHSMDVYSICIMLAYIELKSIYRKFYKKSWTLSHYLFLEKYTREMFPASFIKNGLVVDQRYRMTIDTLLNHLEEDVYVYSYQQTRKLTLTNFLK